MLEQRLARPIAARFGFDIEVFEPDSVPALEGRKRIEPQRKPDRLTVHLRDLAKHLRSVPEQMLGNVVLGGAHLVVEPLVFGQLDDEFEHQRSILALRAPYDEGHGRLRLCSHGMHLP